MFVLSSKRATILDTKIVTKLKKKVNKKTRKNKVFDYKSLIYETELKVLIMFQRDKHLQTDTE